MPWELQPDFHVRAQILPRCFAVTPKGRLCVAASLSLAASHGPFRLLGLLGSRWSRTTLGEQEEHSPHLCSEEKVLCVGGHVPQLREVGVRASAGRVTEARGDIGPATKGDRRVELQMNWLNDHEQRRTWGPRDKLLPRTIPGIPSPFPSSGLSRTHWAPMPLKAVRCRAAQVMDAVESGYLMEQSPNAAVDNLHLAVAAEVCCSHHNSRPRCLSQGIASGPSRSSRHPGCGSAVHTAVQDLPPGGLEPSSTKPSSISAWEAAP